MMSKPFHDMPRMQKLFEEVIGNGKRTESSAEGSGKNPTSRRMDDKSHGCGEDNRDTESNALSVSKEKS